MFDGMLDIKNIKVTYRNGVQALEETNLSLQSGGIYGVLGPSGGGKTSFLKGILDLVPRSGTVRFRGRPIKEFAKRTAYVEQKENLDRNFPLTVFQCVLLGTYPRLGLFKRPGPEEKSAAGEALDQVSLSDFKDRQIGELSGGQFQRVLIARAFVQDADLLFLDEPFVGIDVNNEAEVMELLKEKARAGKTIFIVHHDLNKVLDYFDEVILINEKVIAAGPAEEVYTKENIAKTFKIFSKPVNAEEAV